MYCTGDGVVRDLVEATRWYRRAAEQGEPHAQYNLAVMLHMGDGIAQDVEAAFRWYAKAADQGVPDAQLVLGDFYAAAVGQVQDAGTARRWYEKAAEQDHAAAAGRLEKLAEIEVFAAQRPDASQAAV
jgi:TPR repeat protein